MMRNKNEPQYNIYNVSNGRKYIFDHLDGINYYKGVLLCSRPNENPSITKKKLILEYLENFVEESMLKNNSVWFRSRNTMSIKQKREYYLYLIIIRNGFRNLKRNFTIKNHKRRSKRKRLYSGFKKSNKRDMRRDKN